MTKDFIFNKDTQYGNFIEIVPPGEKRMYGSCIARLLNVPWDDMSVNFAIMLCERDFCKFIPELHQAEVKIIKKSPDESNEIFSKIGTVAWKYTPAKVKQPQKVAK